MCEFTDRLNRQSVWLAILAVALAVWGLTDVRSRARTDPHNPGAHRSDLTCYTAAGAAIFAGHDPYEATNPRGWHYVYPPLLAILVAPLVPLDTQWQGVIWFAISLLTAWGCYTETRRIWRELRSTDNSPAQPNIPNWLIWLTVATMALPTLNCLQRGQVGILLTYLLLLGFRFVLTSRSMWTSLLGGLVLALPVAIKVIPALPVGCLCLLLLATSAFRHWPAAFTWRALSVSSGVATGLLLYLLIIPSFAIGSAANAKYLNTWFNLALHGDKGEIDDDITVHAIRNQSLSNAIYRLGNWMAHAFAGTQDDQSVDNVRASVAARDIVLPMDNFWARLTVRILQAAMLALLLYYGWTAARHDNAWALASVFALSCLLMSAISPVFRGHYYILWLPAVWIIPLYILRNGGPRLAASLAISACALIWIHYLFLPWAGRAGVLGLGASVWYVVATISVLRVKSPVSQQIEPAASRLLEAA
jgi:Glycosyltransferase family 87